MTVPSEVRARSYQLSQRALADLKAAVVLLLTAAPDGLTNSQIGRSLGIYQGHVGHEGHVSRTLLAMLQADGLVQQEQETKRWLLQDPSAPHRSSDCDA